MITRSPFQNPFNLQIVRGAQLSKCLETSGLPFMSSILQYSQQVNVIWGTTSDQGLFMARLR